MKLIITESQALFIGEDFKSHVKNVAADNLGKIGAWGTEKASKIAGKVNPDVAAYAAKTVGVDAPLQLSPEMAARFDDINIERDAPNLHKFLQSFKDQTAASGAADIFKSPDLKKLAKGMVHPLGHKVTINSPYGARDIKKEPNASKFHRAVDLDSPSGSPVYAPLDGVVTRAVDTTPDGCGGHVRIKHNKKMDTKFCHLKKWVVRKGDKVKKGQVIGYTGGGDRDPYRGTSTGPHLHYEIVVNGTSINPTTLQTNLV